MGDASNADARLCADARDGGIRKKWRRE